jgi:hypothetical protein
MGLAHLSTHISSLILTGIVGSGSDNVVGRPKSSRLTAAVRVKMVALRCVHIRSVTTADCNGEVVGIFITVRAL